MAAAPEKIRAIREEGVFEIVWNDDRTSRYPFKFLRCECPCAACVNEFTGERILDPSTVSEEIEPSEVGFSGNYALKIKWSDGHHTGLYSWDHLERLANHLEKVSTGSSE